MKRASPHTPLEKLLDSYSRAGLCRHGSRKVFGRRSGGKPFFRKVSPSTGNETKASTKISYHTPEETAGIFRFAFPHLRR